MLAFMNLTYGHTSNTSSRGEIKGHDIFVYIPQAYMKLILRPRSVRLYRAGQQSFQHA